MSAFDRGSIIYLSPDATETLHELELDKVVSNNILVCKTFPTVFAFYNFPLGICDRRDRR